MNLASKRTSRANQAFSLVELLLTVALLLLFASLSVLSLGSMSQGAALNEGTLRFETLLRFARAQSAYLERRVRVEFVQATNQLALLAQKDAPLNSVQLSWEPNPATEPGVFQALEATRWGLEQVNESVGVEAVRLATSVTAAPSPEPSGELARAAFNSAEVSAAAAPCLTFNPDGSCDTAVIILASRDSQDARRVLVQLEGFTGSVSHREPAVPEALEVEPSSNGTINPARATAGNLAEQ